MRRAQGQCPARRPGHGGEYHRDGHAGTGRGGQHSGDRPGPVRAQQPPHPGHGPQDSGQAALDNPQPGVPPAGRRGGGHDLTGTGSVRLLQCHLQLPVPLRQ